MGTYRIVHAAELRLDRPFEGLGPPPPSFMEALRDASLLAWEKIVQLTIDCEAAALLLAGGLYDGASRGHRVRVRFRQGLERLSARGIPVFISLAAEDSDASNPTWDWPAGVAVFDSPLVRSAPLLRAGRTLASVRGCGEGVADAPARLLDSLRRDPGTGLRIALLAGGAQTPPTDADAGTATLAAAADGRRGFDYWALGSRLAWSATRHPWVVHPGTPQGRGLADDELGPKGVAIIEADADKVVDVGFAPVDEIRLLQLDVEVPPGMPSSVGALLLHELDAARAEHPAVPLIIAARLHDAGSPSAADAGEGRMEALLESLRAKALERRPFVWWASVNRVVSAEPPRPSNGQRASATSIVLERSDALLGAALPRSSFLARCFQPLMNVCDAEIGLGEIRDVVRESASVAIDLLADDEPREEIDGDD